MGAIKKISIRALYLAILLVIMNFVYERWFLEKDLQKHSDFINQVRKVAADSSVVVYLGESSNTTYGNQDLDKRSISQFISDYYPTLKWGTITKEACHSGIYYELLRNIPKDALVKTVIVTMNLRSFDANWIYSDLETPLQKSIVLLKDRYPLYNRLMLSFRGYDVKTIPERNVQFKEHWKNDKLVFPYPFRFTNVVDWDVAMAKAGIRNPDGTKNQGLTELACHYIKSYAFQIDTVKNPRIIDFDRIVRLAHERNWNLVFNLLSENVQTGQRLVGKEIVWLMKQNRDLLVKRYSGKNVFVVDNLEKVDSAEFIDKTWATEHYFESGRKKVAYNVASALKALYPNDFAEAIYNTPKQTTFFNDCDGNYIWGQKQTLSDLNAYSGKYSSITNTKNLFSITLEYPVKFLPDSLKEVEVSFNLFQTALIKDAKLSVEISGEKFPIQWLGPQLYEMSNVTNQWVNVKFHTVLPLDFYTADLVKVYVFNPSEKNIFIDDVKIDFK